MGAILIIIALVLLFGNHDDKKKRNRSRYYGKSDWEKTCDDGGKFFNW